MKPAELLPVERASQLAATGAQMHWLIEGLWADEAVGILGGEPKCCKSFLALDMALSIASGTDCLRQFPARRQGPVLLYPAEDSLPVVRQRLEGIAAAAGLSLESLPIEVITAPALRLDLEADRLRLTNTLDSIRPLLLVLDPLIRLHRVDENDASQIAGLLSFLRQLQRQFRLAVLVVHHARKDGAARPGQALRGSSELHGWGDSNLYLRRRGSRLTLSTEHRAAPSQDHIPLQLTQNGAALALEIVADDVPPQGSESDGPSPAERVRQVLAQLKEPASAQRLRQLCKMRTATFCAVLAELCEKGVVCRDDRGYQLKARCETSGISLSPPIDPVGNGNGKQPSLF